MWCLYQTPPPKVTGQHESGWQQGKATFPHNRTDTHVNSQRLWQHAWDLLKPDKIPAQRREVGTKPPPLWLVPPGKGKVVVLQWSHTLVYQPHSWACPMHRSSGPTQNKLYGFVCFVYGYGFLYFGRFCLFSFCLFLTFIYLKFIFIFRKEQGGEVVGTWEELERGEV